jgi:hypothetical protein
MPVVGTAKPQCPFARRWCYLRPRDVSRLLRGHYSPVIAPYGHMCQSRVALLYFGYSPRSRNLCRLLLAPAAIGIFSTLVCESFLGCLVPYPGAPIGCICLLLPRCHRPSPRGYGSAFRFSPRTQLCVGLFRGCRHFIMFKPPSLFAFQVAPTTAAKPQGGQGFYVRAERASLPPHAPDMLTVRTQAIDGARTYTLLDSQHCRLLHPRYRPLPSGFSNTSIW